MKKIPPTTALVLVFCLGVLGVLGYVSMATGKEIPSSLVAIFSSVVSGLIGYEVGKHGQ
jgi:hypothetical protein